MRSKSKLEATFLNYWRMLAGDRPQPEREYHFARDIVWPGPGIRKRLREAGLRDWRFDFAWPKSKVAVEIEGGIWTHGAHVRGKHFESDASKYNAAQAAGWSVYRFTGGMLERDPAGCIEQVAAALDGHERLPFTDVIGELGSPLCRGGEGISS